MKVRTSDGGQNSDLLSYVPIQNPRPQTPPRHNRIDAMFKINFLSIATHTVYDLICTVRRILASSGDLNPSTHLISLLVNLKTVTLRLTWGLKLEHPSDKSLVMIGRPNPCCVISSKIPLNLSTDISHIEKYLSSKKSSPIPKKHLICMLGKAITLLIIIICITVPALLYPLQTQ